MVKCEICGQEMKAVSWKHLRYEHGLSTDEYRAMGYRTGTEKDCPICSKMFIPDHRGQQTCGTKCGRVIFSKKISGENHPRWGKTFKHTEETKQKIRENHARHWQGKKRPNVGKKISAKLKGRTNVALKGRKFPEREPWNKGKEMPPEYGEKVSRGMYATPGSIRKGPDNHAWKGGITTEIFKQRNTIEYREWQKAVWKRDGYICQICEKKPGRKLIAHHTKCYIMYPELRFEVACGISLCRSCHTRLHNNATFAAKYPQFWKEEDSLYRQFMLPGL